MVIYAERLTERIWQIPCQCGQEGCDNRVIVDASSPEVTLWADSQKQERHSLVTIGKFLGYGVLFAFSRAYDDTPSPSPLTRYLPVHEGSISLHDRCLCVRDKNDEIDVYLPPAVYNQLLYEFHIWG